jgi:5-(carboxyamino)imidazole ribonucleotide synthase
MSPLPLGSTIGIIGGGQLGRFLAAAAAALGYRAHIFSPEPDSPASQVTPLFTIAAYDDEAALTAFAESVDVITFEFENIPAASLALLSRLKPVHPSAKILEISQDRLAEKAFLNAADAPTAPYEAVETEADLNRAIAKLGVPAILKTTRLGYDGKGQYLLRSAEDAAPAFAALSPKPLVLEGFIDFACEISVIVARNQAGEITSFDPVENRHKHHILDLTLAPAQIPQDLSQEATRLARLIAESLNLIGLLAVEMFVTATGGLLINEIAPRPHNSGHWTIDACPVSQFEMHIRAIAGLPLPAATRHADAVMKNLIGPDDMTLWPAILATPNLIPHHYGKSEAREGRKMAHYTRLFPKFSLPGEFGIQDALSVMPAKAGITHK